MLEKLRNMIKEVKADFVDIRYEIKRHTLIGFTGREIRQIGSNNTDGYVVRVLKGGGFSTATVTKEEDVSRALELAVEGAETIVETGGRKSSLEQVPVVRDRVKINLNGDPREIPIDEKLVLTSMYNDLMLEQPSIETTNI